MVTENRLAGAFKFHRDKQSFSASSLVDLVSIFVNFGYSISIEPKDDHIIVDVFETEHFENRPLPFGEDV